MQSKAFTIIELIMMLVVLAVVVWIGIAAMLSGIDTWGFFAQRKELLGDARMAMDRMLRETRAIKNKTSVATANSATFRFTDVNNNDITYAISSGVISRTQNGTTNTLLVNVANLTFTYYDSVGAVIGVPVVSPSETDIRRVRIAVALSKGTSRTVNLQSDVWPRNLR